MSEYMLKRECGCRVTWQEGMPEATWLRYCPKHKAAPDLYEALAAIIGECECEMCRNGRAALAKARGEEVDDA